MRYLLPLLALLSLLLVATPALATISGITVSQSDAQGWSATTETWTHTPAETDPEGIIVINVMNNATADFCTTVTYGGLALTDMTLSPSVYNTASEDSTIHVWFLGVDVDTRASDVVSITCSTGFTNASFAVTFESTEGDMTEVDTTTVKVLTANPRGTLSLGGVTSACVEGIFTGAGGGDAIDPIAASDWTPNNTYEYGYGGSQDSAFYYYSTIGTADVTMGFDGGAEDNHSFGACVREPAAAATGDLLGIDLAGGVSKQ